MDAYIAAEINRRVNKIYKERETRMTNVKFNDLAKELKEFGIELSTIRYSSGEVGFEIEGYLNPDKYEISRGRERCSVQITPKKPLKNKKVGYDTRAEVVKVDKVIFSGPATTILWKDGTKTTVKCSSEDVWDYDVGIAMCYLKKMLGNKGNFNNIFREAMKVAEVQCKKEDLTSSQAAIEGESYYRRILQMRSAIDKAFGGKK